MQTQANETATVAAQTEAAPVASPAPAKAKRTPKAKPATAKRDAKPEAVAKPAKATPAKRDAAADQAKREAAITARTEARTVAADAVKQYYSGASLPFKAAADTFSPTNPKREPKRATQRQAALCAAMLLAGDNVKRDGTFTRGAFVIDGRNVQPESGCLSDMLNRVVTYVSGPTSGAAQRDAVYRFNLRAVRDEITALLTPGAMRTKALQRLDSLGVKAKA